MSRRAPRLSDLDSIDDATKCVAVVIEAESALGQRFGMPSEPTDATIRSEPRSVS